MNKEDKRIKIEKLIRELRKDFGVFFELDKRKSPDHQICDYKLECWLKDKLKNKL
jgi:hypothetical protein